MAEWRSWPLPARLEWEQHGSFKGCLSARKDNFVLPQNNPGVVSSGTVPSASPSLDAHFSAPSHCSSSHNHFAAIYYLLAERLKE